MRNLEFDEVEHRYTLNGKSLPSVTQALSVITNFDHVPSSVLDSARQFGQHVHHACHLINGDDLNWATLDIGLHGHVNAYKQFLVDSGFKVTASEVRVFSAGLGYAGTLDIEGTLRGSTWTVDLKSGIIPRTVGPQTAAYNYARARDIRPRKRACLQLKRDGYKWQECRDASDFSMFLSALNCYRFNKRTLDNEQEANNGRAAAG